MKNLTVIGRILFALPFGVLGINHFIMFNYYLGMVSSFIPYGGFSVIITGIALVSASISIAFKKYIKLSCILLAVLLLIFILVIHIPQMISSANSTVAMIELFKDTGLMGSALFIAGIYHEKEQNGN